MKVCKKCNIEKELDEFNKHKGSKDGYRGDCKSCRKKYLQENKDIIKIKKSIWYENNKESILENKKKYREDNKDKVKKYLEENIESIKNQRSIYYEKNKESILENNRKYREDNKDKLDEYYDNPEVKEHRRNSQKYYRVINKEAISEQKKKYYLKNKEKIKEYRQSNKERTNITQKIRFEKNPILKLDRVIRLSILNSIKRNGFGKKNKTEEILGCTFEYFKSHLESKFEVWMTWENRGLYNGELNYGWDIDHIIPSSSATSEEEIVKLNHYTNLQPLCSRINRNIKKDKLDFV